MRFPSALSARVTFAILALCDKPVVHSLERSFNYRRFVRDVVSLDVMLFDRFEISTNGASRSRQLARILGRVHGPSVMHGLEVLRVVDIVLIHFLMGVSFDGLNGVSADELLETGLHCVDLIVVHEP